MSQHNLRRSLAAFAFATLATLSPLADLHAAPGRQGRSEGRNATWTGQGSFPIWTLLEGFFEKLGASIDGNGLRFAIPTQESRGEKAGAAIDGNGRKFATSAEEDRGERIGASTNGNG